MSVYGGSMTERDMHSPSAKGVGLEIRYLGAGATMPFPFEGALRRWANTRSTPSMAWAEAGMLGRGGLDAEANQ